MFYLLCENRKVLSFAFVMLNRALREVSTGHSTSSVKKVHFTIASKRKKHEQTKDALPPPPGKFPCANDTIS